MYSGDESSSSENSGYEVDRMSMDDSLEWVYVITTDEEEYSDAEGLAAEDLPCWLRLPREE